MMVNMLLTEGQMVKFRNVSLPKGTYVKLQPVTSDFLDISNPKAVLERTLRSYSCLTVGDCFVVHYNNKEYEIEVREAKPGSAISIIETDCQVDFEAPKDYKEPERVPPQPAAPPAAATAAAGAAAPGSSDGAAAEEEPEEPKFVPFVGSGRRLDGRPAPSSSSPAASAAAAAAAARAGTGAAGSSGGATRGASTSSGTSSKAGTFVSTGNRLLDKLQVSLCPVVVQGQLLPSVMQDI
jgi:ubiquitin fusion degradation protein 1